MSNHKVQNRWLSTFIALHILCCGWIFFGVGAISIGGITAWFTNGWVSILGLTLVVLAFGSLGRLYLRSRTQGSMVKANDNVNLNL